MKAQTSKNWVILAVMLFVARLLAGCKDDENNVPVYDTFGDHLEQSYWQGTLSVTEDGNTKNYTGLKIVFHGKNQGEYSPGDDRYVSFEYEADGKNLTIHSENDWGNYVEYSLAGKWWLISLTDNNLQMRTKISNELNHMTLNLQRMY